MFDVTYNGWLVAVSVLIAVGASYVALDLGGRVAAARGRRRLVWLSGGAVSLGLGIWAMHYVGMLAFSLPTPVLYDLPVVFASLAAAIVGSLVALFVASRERPGVPHLLAGGVAMGGAIVGMHYVGMAAMHMAARAVWNPWIVALSVVIAVAGSIVAIRLAVFFRFEEREFDLRKIGSAVMVGAVIVTMHYTGMAAAQFAAAPPPSVEEHLAQIPAFGVAAIAVMTLLVLGLVVLLSQSDRRLGVNSRQLRSSEERYRGAFERSLAGYYRSTLDGRLLECNPAYAQIFGCGSAAECVQTMVTDVYFDPQGREAFLTALREVGLVLNLETRLRKKDGSAVWVLENAVLLPGVDGAPDTIEGNLLDISRRKGTDEAMARATAAAESANRAKSDFLANMSHEIRTPMNGVIGMAELALQTDLTADQREYLEVIKLSADALLGVINDILDFSKIEAGKLDIDPIEFDLGTTLDDLIRSLAPRAHQKGLELAYHVAAGTPATLVGDPGRLRQILVNLVGNAIKFTAKGEVVLRVVTQSTAGEKATLAFSVQDTGIGIAADKQALIFDAFTQADSSTTRHFGGTGLGLTISVHLIDLMEGRVWVESELGVGSTFHVTLPFGVQAARAARAIPRDLADLQGISVLVVDDNATNRRILDEILTNWGMRPTLVDSGQAAIQAMERAIKAGNRFELVLLDFQMPEMDGFQVAQRIKEHPELGATTIMMLSSVGERGDGQRCRELGVAAYLTKPVRQSVLLDALLLLLARAAAGPVEAPALITRHTLREEQRHLRILLAEDNQVNQLVATRILEKRGHTIVVVGNGREALAALDRTAFDLILMDVQMPEMDGREATLAIRERERIHGGHIPIIAVTASAMKGDRDRCFECGMDGYITKPIKYEILIEEVERIGRPAVVPPPGTGVLVSNRSRPLLEAFIGDGEMLREVAEVYLGAEQALLKSFRGSHEEKDSEGVARTAHRLRGSAGAFEADELCAILGRIEQSALAGDGPGIDADFPEFERAMQGLHDELALVVGAA